MGQFVPQRRMGDVGAETLPAGTPAPPAVLDEYKAAIGQYGEAWKAMMEPILAGYQERYERNLAELDRLGKQQREDVNRQYDVARASASQDLVSRGLAGTTALQGSLRGIESERFRDIRRLEDQLTRERLGYDIGLSGDLLRAQQQLGVGGFEAGLRHPTDQYLAARERITGGGLETALAANLGALDKMTGLAQQPMNTDLMLLQFLLGLTPEFQPGSSAASQTAQGLHAGFPPSASSPGPDYGSALIGAGGTAAAAAIPFIFA
jgi:hypothetical protein